MFGKKIRASVFNATLAMLFALFFSSVGIGQSLGGDGSDPQPIPTGIFILEDSTFFNPLEPDVDGMLLELTQPEFGEVDLADSGELQYTPSQFNEELPDEFFAIVDLGGDMTQVWAGLFDPIANSLIFAPDDDDDKKKKTDDKKWTKLPPHVRDIIVDLMQGKNPVGPKGVDNGKKFSNNGNNKIPAPGPFKEINVYKKDKEGKPEKTDERIIYDELTGKYYYTPNIHKGAKKPGAGGPDAEYHYIPDIPGWKPPEKDDDDKDGDEKGGDAGGGGSTTSGN